METQTTGTTEEMRDRFLRALEKQGVTPGTSLSFKELLPIAQEAGVSFKEGREMMEALWEEARAAAPSPNGTHAPKPAPLGERVKAWLVQEGFDWRGCPLPPGTIGRCARDLGVKGNQVTGTLNCFKIQAKRAAARASGTSLPVQPAMLAPAEPAPVTGMSLQAGVACVQLADALLEHGMAGVPEGLRAPLRAILRWRLTEEE